MPLGDEIAGLARSRFVCRDEMWTLGNPSSATLVRVPGRGPAERFFREVVWPVQGGGQERNIS